ncbi:MAG: hypothetical protein ACRDFB_06420 [Rhabdochlamydiaceae bacterium]
MSIVYPTRQIREQRGASPGPVENPNKEEPIPGINVPTSAIALNPVSYAIQLMQQIDYATRTQRPDAPLRISGRLNLAANQPELYRFLLSDIMVPAYAIEIINSTVDTIYVDFDSTANLYSPPILSKAYFSRNLTPIQNLSIMSTAAVTVGPIDNVNQIMGSAAMVYIKAWGISKSVKQRGQGG